MRWCSCEVWICHPCGHSDCPAPICWDHDEWPPEQIRYTSGWEDKLDVSVSWCLSTFSMHAVRISWDLAQDVKDFSLLVLQDNYKVKDHERPMCTLNTQFRQLENTVTRQLLVVPDPGWEHLWRDAEPCVCRCLYCSGRICNARHCSTVLFYCACARARFHLAISSSMILTSPTSTQRFFTAPTWVASS